MKSALLAIFGIILSVAALWIGSYVFSAIPATSWAAFPAFVTSIGLCVAGIIIALVGASKK